MNALKMLIPFFFALLCGLGVGSGGLLVIYLTLVEHLAQHTAQGINLVFFLFAAGASIPVHLVRRRILLSLCIMLMLCGIPGTLTGYTLASLLPGALLRRIFGAFLVLTGTTALAKNDKVRALFGNIHKSGHINN